MRRGFANRHCPKCNGNIFFEKDGYASSEENEAGWYEWCLQCGYKRYLKPAGMSTEEGKVILVTKEPAIA